MDLELSKMFKKACAGITTFPSLPMYIIPLSLGPPTVGVGAPKGFTMSLCRA